MNKIKGIIGYLKMLKRLNKTYVEIDLILPKLPKVIEELTLENKRKEELRQYLDDLDNLIETSWFKNDSIKDYAHYHKDYTIKQFILKGRELIRQRLM